MGASAGLAAMSNQLHSVLRISQSGSIVQLQPFRGQDVDGDTLSIDLTTGSIQLQKRVGTVTVDTANLPCRRHVRLNAREDQDTDDSSVVYCSLCL